MSGFGLQETPSTFVPGAKQPVPADPSWTPLEAWVWRKLHAGEIANIDHYQDNQGPLPPADPKTPEDWHNGRRRLPARFLEAVLLDEPFRSAIHRRGMRIQGAWFEEEIDLSNTELHCPLWLDRTRFERAMDLTDMRGRLVSLRSCTCAASLSLERAQISQGLFMRDGAEFQGIILRGVKIGGQLDLSRANIKGALDLEAANVDESVVMRDAEFQTIEFRAAKVGGQLDLSRAKIHGKLDLQGAEIAQSILMRNGAEFQGVNLLGVRVGGQLSLAGSKVKGALHLQDAHIGLGLFMRGDGAEFNDVV